MAQQKYNPETGQYEDDTNAPDFVQNPNSIGTGTGVVAPKAAGGFDRTAFRDASMSRAAGQSPADFIASHPEFSTGVTSYNGSKDKYVLPGTNEVIDLSINADANGVGTANGWTGAGFNAYGVPDAPAGGGGGGAAGGSSGGAYQDQLRALLLQKLGEFGQPVTGSDPAIAGVNQSYRVARERSAQQERATAAERSAFEGLNPGGQGSGSFRGELQGIQEQSGQDIAGHDASVVLQEVQQRRALLQNFLNMALQNGDNESARQLQMALAQMDNDIKRQSLGQQQSQFNDQFGASRADAYSNDQYRNALLMTMAGQ